MKNEMKRNRYAANEYGDAANMSAGERKISFLNRYFIYKKVRNVDAEKITLDLLGTSQIEQQQQELDTNVAVDEVKIAVEEEKVKKPKKIKRKLVLQEYKK